MSDQLPGNTHVVDVSNVTKVNEGDVFRVTPVQLGDVLSVTSVNAITCPSLTEYLYRNQLVILLVGLDTIYTFVLLSAFWYWLQQHILVLEKYNQLQLEDMAPLLSLIHI